MRILMFGWELPPHNSGGLGVACQGLARALAQGGAWVRFVLPKKVDLQGDDFSVLFADQNPWSGHISKPYDRFGTSLFEEVRRYAFLTKDIAAGEQFDVIHAHDWLSLPAGLAAKEVSGKPLVFHVHATEFDRTGGGEVSQRVYEIEKQGITAADGVIAVSNFTKDILVSRYGAPSQKVEVVHNGITATSSHLRSPRKSLAALKRAGGSIVLFVGRITLQKGPDYFLQAARKVLDYLPHTVFVVAGSGDMKQAMIEQVATLGISDKVIFAGFLRGKELQSVYHMADVLLMPSISEPFGITALEALDNSTPVIISRQSGAAEALRHILKVDFWDTEEMANKIISIVKHPALHKTLRRNGKQEVKKFTWDDAARKCMTVYQQILLPTYQNF